MESEKLENKKNQPPPNQEIDVEYQSVLCQSGMDTEIEDGNDGNG